MIEERMPPPKEAVNVVGWRTLLQTPSRILWRRKDMGDHRHPPAAKMNDVDPFAWLSRPLQRIADGWPESDLNHLLPFNHPVI